MDKEATRALALERRSGIAADAHETKCGSICEALGNLLDEALFARTNITSDPGVCYRQEPFVVALYQAMKSEVSIARFIDTVYERHAMACFPCMMRVSATTQASTSANDFAETVEPKYRMVFRAVSREQYERGGVPFLDHPLRSFEFDDSSLASYPLIDASLLDMVVVPLVAFDDANNRLGYGGGNYDRLLPNLRDDAIVVGVAFDEQQVDAVPCDPHDRRLPRIVTA